jgi:hypothetical protein
MKTLKFISGLFLVMMLLTGCLYNFILQEDEISTDPDDPDTPTISFSQDIIPIFNNNNYCTSCHDTGGQIPDLTSAKAFASLNSTRYINSASPEESKIYAWPHPDTDSHSQKKYTSTQAAQVLIWINQGAKNN